MLQRFFRIFLFVVCFFTVFHSTGFSQRGRMSVEERLKMLTDQLTLTPAQAESVKVIYIAGDSVRTKLFAEHQDDRSAVRESMRKLNDEQDKKIEALLTDEQKVKYLKLLEERQKRFAPRPEPRDTTQH
jgi:hypothetical protein